MKIPILAGPLNWLDLSPRWPVDPNAPKVDYIEQAMIRICQEYNVDPNGKGGVRCTLYNDFLWSLI